MAETILLRSQPHEYKAAYKVTGVELPDGTNFRGFNHESNAPEATLALEWSTQEAERVAEFYHRYLTKPRGEQDSGWNCHSFVTTVKGWDSVRWTGGAFPGYMPKRLQFTAETDLKDGHPYAVSTLSGIVLRHSVLGLPEPSKNLSVRGLGGELCIADNNATLEVYGGAFYAHKPPTKLDTLFARALFINHQVIPASALQTPQSPLQPLLSRIIL